MLQQKLNKDTILHYGSMLLGAAVLSFGLFNVHSQSKITEGGILGLTLFLHHWTGISPGIFSFLLDMTCYIIGFRLLGTDFLKNAIFSTCCYALLYRFWEFTGPFLPSYADKPLIAAILGGLFVGIGAGLIVRRGGASGGDDALAPHPPSGDRLENFPLLLFYGFRRADAFRFPTFRCATSSFPC